MYGDDGTGTDPILIALATETARCLSNVGKFVDKYKGDARTVASLVNQYRADKQNGVTPQEILATAGNETRYGSTRPEDKTLVPQGNFFGLHGTGHAGQIDTYTTKPEKGKGVDTPVFPLSSGFVLSGQALAKRAGPPLAKANAADPRTFFETIHAFGWGERRDYVDFMMLNRPGRATYGPYFLVGACLPQQAGGK